MELLAVSLFLLLFGNKKPAKETAAPASAAALFFGDKPTANPRPPGAPTENPYYEPQPIFKREGEIGREGPGRAAPPITVERPGNPRRSGSLLAILAEPVRFDTQRRNRALVWDTRTAGIGGVPSLYWVNSDGSFYAAALTLGTLAAGGTFQQIYVPSDVEGYGVSRITPPMFRLYERRAHDMNDFTHASWYGSLVQYPVAIPDFAI